MIGFQLTEFAQYCLIGLGNGAIYAMVGLGLVVIFRSTGLLNFSQGEIAMFSTFLVWQLHEVGLPVWLAMLGGMVLGFGFGAMLYRVAVQPAGDPHTNPLAVVIITIGLFLGVNSLAQLIWGTGDKDLEPLFGRDGFIVAGVSVDWQKIGTLAVLAFEVALLYLIFNKTKIGLAMRAVASGPESSALAGIPVTQIILIGWGVAASLGALAGTFAAPSRGLNSSLMLQVLVLSLAAITLGGFDSLVGAVVGGLIVGLATDVIPKYVGFLDKVPLAPAFAIILIVLLVKPEGLFGSKRVTRV